MGNDIKLVEITESISDKIYDMFQEFGPEPKFFDTNHAYGMSTDDFRKYCAMLEMANKGILLTYAAPAISNFVLFDAGKAIGWFSLKAKELKCLRHAGHIGYIIRPTEQGKGYGSSGLRLIVKEAQRRGYNQVTASTDDENSASVRMLKSCGFNLLPNDDKEQIYTRNHCRGVSMWYFDFYNKKERIK